MREKIKIVTITLVLLSLVLAGCGEMAQPEDTRPTKPAVEPSTMPAVPVTEPQMPAESPTMPTAPMTEPQMPAESPTMPAVPVTEPQMPAEPAKEEIPSISLVECLKQIKETNPEMPDQQAKDNCYTIEALNTNDKSLCNEVSEEFRPICEQQFE